MWQRKQTVFLALAALLALATWLFPVVTYDRGRDQFIFRTTGLVMADGTPVLDADLKAPFHVVLSVVAVALIGCIFFYGNRPRQIRFVRSTYLVTLAIIAFLFITDNSIQSYLESGGGVVVSRYGASFFLPLGILVFSVLAERSIRSDEELVRSTDRLR